MIVKTSRGGNCPVAHPLSAGLTPSASTIPNFTEMQCPDMLRYNADDSHQFRLRLKLSQF